MVGTGFDFLVKLCLRASTTFFFLLSSSYLLWGLYHQFISNHRGDFVSWRDAHPISLIIKHRFNQRKRKTWIIASWVTMEARKRFLKPVQLRPNFLSCNTREATYDLDWDTLGLQLQFTRSTWKSGSWQEASTLVLFTRDYYVSENSNNQHICRNNELFGHVKQ